MPDQVRLSELRAGLNSGKVTMADLQKFHDAGISVIDDEQGQPSTSTEPNVSVQHNFAGIKYDYDPNARGDENGGGVAGYAKQGLKSLGEAGIGAGKGAIGTLYHIGKFVGAVPENKDFEAALETDNPAQTTGKIAENVAELMMGEAAAAKGLKYLPAATAAAPRLSKAVGAAVAGGLVGGAQTDNSKDALINAALSGGGSLAADFLPGIAKKLKESAVGAYQRALNPGSKWAKNLSQKVAPELVKKGVVGSLGTLADRSAAEMGTAADEIDKAWASLPPDAKVPAAPMIDALEQAKQGMRYTGPERDVTRTVATGLLDSSGNPITRNVTDKVAESGFKTPLAQKYASQHDALKKVISDSADEEGAVNAHDLRGLRKIWDDVVTAAPNNSFTGSPATLADRAVKLAHENAANAVRESLNSSYPDIAELNRRFTFWKRVNKVVQDTMLRKTGQVGALEKVAAVGGGMAGFGTAGP